MDDAGDDDDPYAEVRRDRQAVMVVLLLISWGLDPATALSLVDFGD